MSTLRIKHLRLNFIRDNRRYHQYGNVRSRMNSYDAVKRIKDLQRNNNKNMIPQAFEIYNDLEATQQNEFVINALLNCCKKRIKHDIDINAIKVINQIKSSIMNSDDNVHAKTSLINIFGELGDIDNSFNIFNTISQNNMDVTSINAMMKVLYNNGEYEKSILLHQQSNGKHSDVSNILFIKACINIEKYNKAKDLVDSTIENINDHKIEFITTLIDFCGKSGDTNNAVNIFNRIQEDKRDIVSINAMLNAYNDNGEYDKARCLYEQFHDKVDDVSHMAFIKACINTNDYEGAKGLINSKGKDINEHSIEFITTLIDFYGKVGEIENALDLFNSIPRNKIDIISIGAMMKAYNDNEEYNKSIQLYEEYNGKHNGISNVLFIKACINICNYDKPKEIINSLTKNLNIHSIEVINTLIDYYGKSGALNAAINIFQNISLNKRNVVSISAMMNAYNNNEEYDAAILLFEQYNGKHDDVSNIAFIKACICNNNYDKVKQLIRRIVNNVNNHSIEFVNTLIDFYGRVKDIDNARKIFNEISKNRENIVSINAMMNVYNNNEEYDKSIELYQQYNDLLFHNDVSNILFIKACINIGHYDKAKELIDSIKTTKDINSHSIRYITTLIDFYGKRGDIDNALNIFDNLSAHKRDISCFNVMMNTYNDNGEYDKTIDIFNKISVNYNMNKNEYTFCEALIAAGNLVSPYQGQLIMDELNNYPDILKSLYVQSAMIIINAKCDKSQAAISIFENNINKYDGPIPDDTEGLSNLYAAIMDCYAKQGDIDKLLSLFNDLKKDKRKTISKCMYLIVLNGCAHSGLVDQALSIFDEMKIRYKYNKNKIDPQSVNVLIDCLGRKGGNYYLNEAETLYNFYIENNRNIYYKLKLSALRSLLSSCRIHNDTKRGERIFDKINIILNKNENENDENAYIMLSNIYGQNKDFDKVNEIRGMTRNV